MEYRQRLGPAQCIVSASFLMKAESNLCLLETGQTEHAASGAFAKAGGH